MRTFHTKNTDSYYILDSKSYTKSIDIFEMIFKSLQKN